MSNESNEPVYFDNFTVVDTRGRIIEEDHYYAFGLRIAGISSVKFGDPNEGMLDNKNLYNDKELFEDADLEWYDYGFRSYDPQIGRFTQLDPLTDDYPHYTPFQYAGNEPIANVDLDGLEEFNALQTLNTVVIDGSHVAKSATNIASHALYASMLSLSRNFINPNISESTCIPCASQKQYMEATGKQIQNNVLPKSTIGPDNYIASQQEQAINTQKMSDAGYVNGNLNFLARAAQNRTWNNFTNNIGLPITAAALGEGIGKIAFEGVGYFLKGAKDGGLFHYTTSAAANSISKSGLNLSRDGFVYSTTKSGLSPIQAQIELSLSPNRGLPNALFKIDVQGLRKAGINPIIGPRTVTGGNFGAGGGIEVLFNKPIPIKYLIRLK